MGGVLGIDFVKLKFRQTKKQSNMRQIKFIIIDDRGKIPQHHYTIVKHGFVIKETNVRNPVKIFDKSQDTDRYNAHSVVVGFSGSRRKCNPKQRETLIDLLIELRHRYPSAKIFGLSEIGSYYIQVSSNMNCLRFILSEVDPMEEEAE